MVDNPPLLIRADASTHIGTGHVMRCLALSQAWQEAGGAAWFALASATSALEARLAAEGMEIAHLSASPGSAPDANQTAALAQQIGAAWVVVDGYQFDAEYQRAIKGSGLRLLFVDDYGHASYYWADVVLNQNIYADESLVPSREPTTKLLMGTRYALLRREFWPWRGWQRQNPEMAGKVLVTMGGADADNVTLKVLEALRQVDRRDLKVRVVVGSSNPHRRALREMLEGSGTPEILLVENISNMPDLMAWANLAVSAAGSTCWELAFMQLPSLLLVLADNQRPNAEGLDAAGVALNLGWHKDVSSAQLARALEWLLTTREAQVAMARKGRPLVDGEGGFRVADLMAETSVRVRPASEGDRKLLFQWVNDPLTRHMSLRSEPICWEDHTRWFDRVSGDPAGLLLIAEWWKESRWTPVGQVRIDGDGIVSIAIAPEYRGQRLAQPILQTAVACFKARFPEKILTAYIKPENQPSLRAFSQAGFECAGQVEVRGQPCLKYVSLTRNPVSRKRPDL